MYKLESIIADMRWRFHSKREEKYWLAVKEYASKEKLTNNASIQKFPSFERNRDEKATQ